MMKAMRRAVMRVINMYTKCLEIWGESLLNSLYGMA